MSLRALIIGGTGPTGPPIAAGLEARGFDVTLLHSGRHEVPEVAHLPHIHGDPFSEEGLREALGTQTFDLVLAAYGRLRTVAEVLQGRTDRFLSIGGVPVYRGFFDAAIHSPPGLPVPTREDCDLATEAEDGKSYRIGRTEELVFERHPGATHFRYPYVYGPRQPVPREWCVVRRIIDGRSFIVLPDGGLTLIPFGYVDNLAHAVLLAVDHPRESAGQVFNCTDEETLTIHQVVEIISSELESPLEVVSMPADLALPARPLMMMNRTTHRVMDIAKIRYRLGYRDLVPARQAIRLTARWLVDHPPAPGGPEEAALEDPFDYPAEDRLVGWWRRAVSDAPDLGYEQLPGFGLAYAGPGTGRVRSDKRI